ncbi:hypothetical protein [Salinibaculum marinum]|uniref:hypothetical protein n=1 Tax=Salinibaculum marinum TaxID=3131993 RepID=UPI0030CE7030
MPNNDSTQTTVDEILNIDEGDSEDESDIFEKPWLLEIDNVPDANRIVGRDDHITFLAKNLRKMRTNSVPDNVLEWGETGTGKTLVARHVCERLEAATAGTDSPSLLLTSTQTPSLRIPPPSERSQSR